MAVEVEVAGNGALPVERSCITKYPAPAAPTMARAAIAVNTLRTIASAFAGENNDWYVAGFGWRRNPLGRRWRLRLHVGPCVLRQAQDEGKSWRQKESASS
jgi:hypothetical protein